MGFWVLLFVAFVVDEVELCFRMSFYLPIELGLIGVKITSKV